MEISCSILNAVDRIKTIEELNATNVDYIHFDVMDGIFVQNKQFSIPELVDLIKKSKKKNDVHLMVNNPLPYIDAIKNLDVSYITIHVEIDNVKETLDYIKKNHIKCGLAVDLDTNITKIYPYLNIVDMILIMSVKAGYGGQTFNEKALTKITKLNGNFKIEVDGGIDDVTIEKIMEADIVVSGSYILNNLNENIEKLRNA